MCFDSVTEKHFVPIDLALPPPPRSRAALDLELKSLPVEGAIMELPFHDGALEPQG